MKIRETDIARFKTKFKPGSKKNCWLWQGTNGSAGYGQFKWFDPRKNKFVTIGPHRFSLMVSIGKLLPPTIFTDHICRTLKCVNPNHLRAVDIKTSNTENCDTFGAVNKRKTHCKRGHSFSGENLGRTGPWRYCKTCVKEGGYRLRAEKRARAGKSPRFPNRPLMYLEAFNKGSVE